MALKLTAIILDESFDESDIVSIVRRALLNAGCNVDSVDCVGVAEDAVLYVNEGGTRVYVEVVPSKSKAIVWTKDIDRAKVCHGPASIADCAREVKERNGFVVMVLHV